MTLPLTLDDGLGRPPAPQPRTPARRQAGREAARRLLRRLTFHAYAEHYPDHWLGHWTFADSLESTRPPREGLYAPRLPGAFRPFCAHAHAWMLYGSYKLQREG